MPPAFPLNRRSLLIGSLGGAVALAFPRLAFSKSEVERVDTLIGRMTIEEKAGQMSCLADSFRPYNPPNPVVGVQELAAAVRAAARLPRVKMLVLAGSLMGGTITEAVKEVQSLYGLRVISLNQAGSVTDVADLVVSDPVQAGVMAVMAVADTARFDLMKQLKRR